LSAPRRIVIAGEDRAVAAAACERAGLQVVRRDADLVLCHGGDGTLLRAARDWPGLPKLPVRVASRNQLCPDHQLDGVLARLQRGELPRTELDLLELRLGGRRFLAINDVVLRNESPATALRFRVHADGHDSGEVTGDGLVFATPFGSTGYFRSITRRRVETGLGVAFNNSTDVRSPLVLDGDEPIEVEVLRGPAVLVHDNDARTVLLRDGQRFRVRCSGEHEVVLGLDALCCQRCRKQDGSRFNAH